jgi:hypothetical protein
MVQRRKSSMNQDTGSSSTGLAAELVRFFAVHGDLPGAVRLEVAAHQRTVPVEAVLFQDADRTRGEVPGGRTITAGTPAHDLLVLAELDASRYWRIHTRNQRLAAVEALARFV